MATPGSIVSVCRENAILFCRVEGWGTMTHSLALRQHAEACLDQGATALRVDLRNCDYLDSTFLGTLVCLNRQFSCSAPDGFGLVSPSPRCCALLAKMKLDAVLPVCSADFPQEGWAELRGNPDDAGLQSCVVQAHRELASVPGPASACFHDIAAALTREWEARQGHG
jgi:anti-anti-sigma regulatory factor